MKYWPALMVILVGCEGFQMVGGPRAMSLSLAPSKSCAVMSDDGVRCWGNRPSTQLEEEDSFAAPYDARPRPVPGVVDAVAVGSSLIHDCAIKTDRTISCWSEQQVPATWSSATGALTILTAYPDPCLVGQDHVLRCGAALGDISPIDGGSDVADGTLLGPTRCLRHTDGTVGCAGANDRGQLGDGSKSDSVTFTQVAVGERTLEVGLGDGFGCLLSENGNVYCWGVNDRGQLGDGSQLSRPLPRLVRGITWATQLSVGLSHACALYADGRVFCWGANDRGQLGDGTSDDRLEATQVVGLDKVSTLAVAWAGAHSCALTHTGELRCWGANERGQLGDGTLNDRSTPVPVRF